MQRQLLLVLLSCMYLQVQAHARQENAGDLRALALAHRWQELSSRAGEAVRLDPQNRQAHYWLGSAELELLQFVPAVQSFREAQKLGLDDAPLHEQLGLAYYRLNQFMLFEREMNAAIERDPKDFLPQYYLGLYQLMLRSDLVLALQHFQAAGALAPNDWKVLYQQGNCWEKQGRNEKAREYYLRSAAAVEKENAQFGWPFQGLARLILTQDPAAALKYAEQSVERNPHEYSNYLTLARAHNELGETQKAIEAAKLAVAENPDDADTHYLLFRLYRKIGEKDAATLELATFKELQAAYGTQ